MRPFGEIFQLENISSYYSFISSKHKCSAYGNMNPCNRHLIKNYRINEKEIELNKIYHLQVLQPTQTWRVLRLHIVQLSMELLYGSSLLCLRKPVFQMLIKFACNWVNKNKSTSEQEKYLRSFQLANTNEYHKIEKNESILPLKSTCLQTCCWCSSRPIY